MSLLVRKFNSYLTLVISVIGIQLLLLPFYHFHPDHQHSHHGELPPHKHNAYFHSLELDSIAHLTHSHDHNSASHHQNHSENNDEESLKFELNKVSLKSKNSFKVVKVFSVFSSSDIPQKFKSYRLLTMLNDFFTLGFQHQLRERSPPSSFI